MATIASLKVNIAADMAQFLSGVNLGKQSYADFLESLKSGGGQASAAVDEVAGRLDQWVTKTRQATAATEEYFGEFDAVGPEIEQAAHDMADLVSSGIATMLSEITAKSHSVIRGIRDEIALTQQDIDAGFSRSAGGGPDAERFSRAGNGAADSFGGSFNRRFAGLIRGGGALLGIRVVAEAMARLDTNLRDAYSDGQTGADAWATAVGRSLPIVGKLAEGIHGFANAVTGASLEMVRLDEVTKRVGEDNARLSREKSVRQEIARTVAERIEQDRRAVELASARTEADREDVQVAQALADRLKEIEADRERLRRTTSTQSGYFTAASSQLDAEEASARHSADILAAQRDEGRQMEGARALADDVNRAIAGYRDQAAAIREGSLALQERRLAGEGATEEMLGALRLAAAEAEQAKTEQAAAERMARFREQLISQQLRLRDLDVELVDIAALNRRADWAAQTVEQLKSANAELEASKRHREELNRMAQSTVEATRTPQEKLEARAKELGELFAQKLIDEETLNRAIRQAAGEVADRGPVRVGGFQQFDVGRFYVQREQAKAIQDAEEARKKQTDAVIDNLKAIARNTAHGGGLAE